MDWHESCVAWGGASILALEAAMANLISGNAPIPSSVIPTTRGREQYEGQFSSLRLIFAIGACVAVIVIALFLR